MWNKLIHIVLYLAALQILTQFITVECKIAQTMSKGKGKAFGAGIAAGGLAGVLGGAAIGHFLTKDNSPQEIHHHHYIVNDPISSVPNTAINNPVPAPPQRTTIIERGEVLPNGCYKQTVKEPDQHDSSKYIETEQLICPQNLPVATQQIQPVAPVASVIPVPAQIQPIQPPHETISSPLQPNPPAPAQPSPAPLQPYPATPTLAPNVAPALPVMPVINNPLPQPALMQPVQSVVIPAPTDAAPPQVIVLSKTTGFYGDEKKKNAATTLLVNSFGFLLSMIVITGFF